MCVGGYAFDVTYNFGHNLNSLPLPPFLSLSLSLWPHRSPILNLVPLSVHISRLSCRHTCSPRQFRFQFRMLSMRWRATTPLLNPRPRFTKEKQANLFAKFKQHFVVFFFAFFWLCLDPLYVPSDSISPSPSTPHQKVKVCFLYFSFFFACASYVP